MPAIRRTKFLELFWRLHRWVFTATNGRVGGRLMGHRVLLLNTLGRKSGLPRANTLYYFPCEGSYVVIASNVGSSVHPGWYHNLQARPDATVVVEGQSRRVRARDAQGQERAALWSMVVAKDSSYAEYQGWTEREFPVVVLDPVEPG